MSLKDELSNNKIATVDANAIAVKYRLGPRTSPIVNTAILGAFCKVTGICDMKSLEVAIMKGVPVKPEANAEAANEAYEAVKFVSCQKGEEDVQTAETTA